VSERRASTLPLYVGGFLGPFGGGVIAVLIPQLRDAFDASTGQVAAAVPAYLVPFAVLSLASGTIGERLGRARVVRAGYVAYAVASLAAALSPGIGVFLALRAAQGAANAFLSPLLLAGLADVTPPERLGRSVGTFAAVQTAAVAVSPLCGGLLGAADWRLAFLAPAGVAVALARVPPKEAGREEELGPASFRALLTRRVGLLSAAAFAAYASITGLTFLVALRAADDFGLASIERGLLLAGFGVAGMVLGRAAGNAADRVGRVMVAIGGTLGCAVLIVLLGLAGSAAALAALWALAGAGSAFVWAGINTLTVVAVPGNRAGATSLVSAFRFAGNAVAPVMWLPLYHVHSELGFGAAAAMAALAGAFVLPLRSTPDHKSRRSNARPAASATRTR
jgi:MFS family permease